MGDIFGFLLLLYSVPWLHLHMGCSCCPCPCKRHSLQEVRKHFFLDFGHQKMRWETRYCTWPDLDVHVRHVPYDSLHVEKRPGRPIFDLIDFVAAMYLFMLFYVIQARWTPWTLVCTLLHPSLCWDDTAMIKTKIIWSTQRSSRWAINYHGHRHCHLNVWWCSAKTWSACQQLCEPSIWTRVG